MSNLPAKTIKTAPPLLSLFLLLITSLYMFVLRYAAKWRGGRRAGA
jgi:hypothetical protein